MIRKTTPTTKGDRGASPVEFPAPAEARRFLRTLLTDPLSVHQLRRTLSEERTGYDISRLSDQQVVHLVSSKLLSGHFRLRAVRLTRAGVGQATSAEREEALDDTPAAPPLVADPTHWIEFELVDPDGEPVPDVAYHATFPDGRVREGTLDRNGRARILSLDVTGECTVRFPGLEGSGGGGASSKSGPDAAGPGAGKEPHPGAPPEDAGEEHVLEFALLSPHQDHVLPFHPFRVLDADGSEVASGETDENGEASVAVPRPGEYTVVAESTDEYVVGGTAFRRDARTPLAEEAIQATTSAGTTLSLATDSRGSFELTGVPGGELVLRFRDAELPIHVDRDISGGTFAFPWFEADQEEGEDNDPEPVDFMPVEPIDIDPDEY